MNVVKNTTENGKKVIVIEYTEEEKAAIKAKIEAEKAKRTAK